MATKTAGKKNTLTMKTALAGGNIRIDVHAIKIPEELRVQAEDELFRLIPTLPNPITYPLAIPTNTDNPTRMIISDWAIQYVSMLEYEKIIDGPNCGNGQCIVDGELICCPKDDPDTLMASVDGEGVTVIHKKAFLAPLFFDLKFYDSANMPLIAYQGTLSGNPQVRYIG